MEARYNVLCSCGKWFKACTKHAKHCSNKCRKALNNRQASYKRRPSMDERINAEKKEDEQVEKKVNVYKMVHLKAKRFCGGY